MSVSMLVSMLVSALASVLVVLVLAPAVTLVFTVGIDAGVLTLAMMLMSVLTLDVALDWTLTCSGCGESRESSLALSRVCAGGPWGATLGDDGCDDSGNTSEMGLLAVRDGCMIHDSLLSRDAPPPP